MTLFRRNNDVVIALCVRWDRTTLPLRPRLHNISNTLYTGCDCSGCWFHLGSAYLHIISNNRRALRSVLMEKRDCSVTACQDLPFSVSRESIRSVISVVLLSQGIYPFRDLLFRILFGIIDTVGKMAHLQTKLVSHASRVKSLYKESLRQLQSYYHFR